MTVNTVCVHIKGIHVRRTTQVPPGGVPVVSFDRGMCGARGAGRVNAVSGVNGAALAALVLVGAATRCTARLATHTLRGGVVVVVPLGARALRGLRGAGDALRVVLGRFEST